MQSGFNTNIRHRAVLFHVQTEDSGRRRPHIVTHLYYEGTILASEKHDYAEKLAAADLTAAVRELMEAQHNEMLKRLQAGGFDGLIEERLGASIFQESAETTGSRTQPETAASAPSAQPVAPRERTARAFGEGVISRKPLDEVVLEYLVDNARKRRRSSKPAK